MRLRRLSAALLAVATAGGLAAAVPSAASAARLTAEPPGTTPDQPIRITLITGDRVTVSGRGIAFEHGPGRAGVRTLSYTADGHQYVIPTDALPLIRQKRLDQRFFDVTTLRGFGYTGDADLPLLVSYPKTGKGKGPSSVRAAAGATTRLGRDLPGVGMQSMRTPATGRSTLWTALTTGPATARTLRPGIDRIYLDGKLKLSDDISASQIGAPTAWQQGLDGTGVTVAVLDSGIDATHPDFAGKIVASQNFTTEPSTDDLYGHGTHVASIIAGSGAESGGKYKGVAPGAKLAIGKVCEAAGFCDESAVLAGMQWAAQTAPVVNMSLGGYDAPDMDPTEQAVEDLTAEYGTLFVIAAGNRGGPGRGTIDSPASAPSALAVGSVDYADRLYYSSAKGPNQGDGAIKPDITAPGVNITAARAANGHIGDPAPAGYANMTGTSMATPHVAAAAAIITELHPRWTPQQRKTLLMGAADPIAGTDVFGQGAGRLNVARAIGQNVSVDEGSVTFGEQQWPHDDDVPVTKTLTYRNAGSQPVSLTLSVEGDTGTFSTATNSLTVPAGGTATTAVTADTSGAGTDGFKSARIVASTADGVRVETPVVIDRHEQEFTVKLRHLGRDGQPNLNYWTGFVPLSGQGTGAEAYWGLEEESVQLPKGTYGVYSLIYGANDTTMLVQPSVVVGADTTMTLDARAGRPVTITPPRPDARQAGLKATAYWTVGAYMIADSVTPGDIYTAQIGPKTTSDGFIGSINSVFARGDNGDFRDSSYTYDTIYSRKGSFFTGFDKRITTSELGKVNARYAAGPAGTVGVQSNWPVLDGNYLATVPVPVTLPSNRTEYFNSQERFSWQSDLDVQTQTDDPDSFPETLTHSSGPTRQYTPGAVNQQDWNTAVYAPSVASEVYDDPPVVRKDNEISASIPLFSDGAGNPGQTLTLDGARVALYSGDTLVGEAASDHGTFKVPAARAGYRLQMSARRSAPFRLSTSVSGEWTFASSDGDAGLPLSTVRFSPRLDAGNNAPAGPFAIPATVERSPGSDAAANRRLTADFSTDDGKTWRPATVTGSGDQRTVKATNPASGFVSLRVTATDAAGNTAAVTVIRAYGIR
ncbi:S8 family serine peptidase [Actinoplanes sp. TBRC 11911]|uniref:S8 family serine peptidase n=1 Tax=Actinoplanes sp. TBRC 11911 TaxID=2729386 RepID=UPI00145F9B05|nr:S8 family serine peptidase [Actinoplanes sp. TBRC 11911]NMO50905.1 S8 family serine peptidase [Actinoplanes sp. TBRC 11911]